MSTSGIQQHWMRTPFHTAQEEQSCTAATQPEPGQRIKPPLHSQVQKPNFYSAAKGSVDRLGIKSLLQDVGADDINIF